MNILEQKLETLYIANRTYVTLELLFATKKKTISGMLCYLDIDTLSSYQGHTPPQSVQ